MENNLIQRAVIARTGLPTVKRTLDLAALRQKITAGNIANAQTVGYRRRTVDFEGELKRLASPTRLPGLRTHERHISIGDSSDRDFEVKTEKEGDQGVVNNVDVESEMADLAQTQIWYQLGTTLARKKFAGLRLAIKGER